MTEDELKTRFEWAKGLIAEAGDLALGYFRNLASLDIQSKGLQDMASQADIETEQLIRVRIQAAFPEDAFFGEETGGFEPESGQGVWVVDPIDGTANFVAGLSLWCVSIAYVVDKEIRFGLVFDPIHDELFTGIVGGGAKLNGQDIAPSAATSIQNGRITLGFSHRSSADEIAPLFRALLSAGGMYGNYGSGAIGLVNVACGRMLGYYEPHINSWDCYGAVAVLREAGAYVNDAEAGDGLIHGTEILALAPGITEEFQDLLKNARAST